MTQATKFHHLSTLWCLFEIVSGENGRVEIPLGPVTYAIMGDIPSTNGSATLAQKPPSVKSTCSCHIYRAFQWCLKTAFGMLLQTEIRRTVVEGIGHVSGGWIGKRGLGVRCASSAYTGAKLSLGSC